MPTPTCAFTKPNGSLCAARPLPGSDFCLFHDPAHQDTLAQSRSKGGSAPRRRLRRYPRLLDHMHVAELLSELFIDALNDPEAIDTQRLHALTALARTLLKAVGTPPTFLVHSDRREPHPDAGHLLRIFPPLTPETESLLAAEPPADPDTHQPPPPASSPLEPIRTLEVGDGDAWHANAEFLPAKEPPAARPASPLLPRRRVIPPPPPSNSSDPSDSSDSSDPSDPSDPLAGSRAIPAATAAEALAGVGAPQTSSASVDGRPSAAAPPPPRPPDRKQAGEQVRNRPRTGPSPADELRELLHAAFLSLPFAPKPAPEAQGTLADRPAPGIARPIRRYSTFGPLSQELTEAGSSSTLDPLGD